MLLLLEASFRSCLLATVVWLGVKLIRVTNPRIEMTVWISVLLASVAMPLLMRVNYLAFTLPNEPPPEARLVQLPPPPLDPFPVDQRVPPAEPQEDVAVLPPPTATPMPSTAETATAPAADQASRVEAVVISTPETVIWRRLAVGIYAMVAAILLIRILIGVARIVWRSRSDQPGPDCGGVRVRVTGMVSSPVTFGSTILLPRNYHDWDDMKLNAALSHERSHVRHHDFYVLLLAALYRSVFWVNPMAWFLSVRIAALAEMRSDDEAIETIGDRLAYAEILLSVANDLPPPTATLAMASRPVVVARLERILETDTVSKQLSWCRCMLLSAGLAPLILAVSSQIAYSELTPEALWSDFTARRASGLVGTKAVSPTLLESYEGYYAADPKILPDLVLTVSQENGHLFVQRTGQSKAEVFPESERDFFYGDQDYEISFVATRGSPAIGIVLHQNGTHIRARRVGFEEAQHAAELFDERFADQSRRRQEVQLDRQKLDRLVGHYQDNPNSVLSIWKEGDRLFGRYSGDRKRELFAEDESHFFFKDIQTQISLNLDDQGRVNGIVSHHNGRRWPARTISESEAVSVDRRAAVRAQQYNRILQMGDPIVVDPQKLAQVTGFYQFDSSRVLAVTRNGSHLFARLGEQPRFEIFPASELDYFNRAMPADIHFTMENGLVTGLALNRGNQHWRLPRIAAVPSVDGGPSSVDANPLSGIEGQYWMSNGSVLTIRRDGDSLLAERSGQPSVQILTVRGDAYFSSALNLSFVPAGEAETRALVVFSESTGASRARRIDAATARRLEAGFTDRTIVMAERFLHQKQAQGSEAALREFIIQAQQGKVEYGRVSPELADGTRAMIPRLHRDLITLGPLQSLRFEGVELSGYDAFEAKFANGSIRFRLMLSREGMIGRLAYRSLGDDTPGGYLPCSAESTLDIKSGTPPIRMAFVNHSAEPIGLYSLDASRQRTFGASVGPNDRASVRARMTGAVVVTDANGSCIGIVRPGRTTRNSEVRTDSSGTVVRSPVSRSQPLLASETKLRHFIASVRDGHPDYGSMTPSAAAKANEEFAVTSRVLARLGEFQSLSFSGGASSDGDDFQAAFANGSVEMHVDVLPDGSISHLALGPE